MHHLSWVMSASICKIYVVLQAGGAGLKEAPVAGAVCMSHPEKQLLAEDYWRRSYCRIDAAKLAGCCRFHFGYLSTVALVSQGVPLEASGFVCEINSANWLHPGIS